MFAVIGILAVIAVIGLLIYITGGGNTFRSNEIDNRYCTRYCISICFAWMCNGIA